MKNEVFDPFPTEEQEPAGITRADFEKLLGRRANLARLLDYMEEHGFFEAACSGGHHLCVEGGLAKHSVNVRKNALQIAKAMLTPEEYRKMKQSISFAALLHDLGKMGDYGEALYIPNILKSGKQSAAKPYVKNKALLPIEHAETSVNLIRMHGVPLTMEEAYAIRYHDGLYLPGNSSVKSHETKLYLILHTADLWASRFDEVCGADDEDSEG